MAQYGMPFDPYALDMYGIPWYYHMYPVHIQGPMSRSRSPKKRRTFPSNRTRGGSSPSKPYQLGASSSTANKPETDSVAFSAQLDEIARHAAARRGKAPQQAPQPAPVPPTFPNTPTRPRQMRSVGNGLYNTVGRRGRLAGVPIEATTPFPTPVPPTGRRDAVSYEIVKHEESCNVYNIERAAEWGGSICNKCAPDH